MYIKKYLETRTDNNEALLGKEMNINKVHSHKFRREMAIDKGRYIEMEYAW